MSFYKEVWETFSAIDANALKKKESGVEYITWSKAWIEIMKYYPASTYDFSERDITAVGDDGPFNTVEVSCILTIVENDTRPRKAVRTMHLPVMHFGGQFRAIPNPTARHISDSRMRALVKAAAMFGLGITLWSGDEFQAVDKTQEKIVAFAKLKAKYRRDLWRTADVIKDAFVTDDQSTAIEAWDECNEQEKEHLWIAETKGGFFTQAEKEWFRAARIVTE